MPKLCPGDAAPKFSSLTESGEPITLDACLARGPVVLIFYPMDNTPGCTAQLCAVRDDAALYRSAGVSVFGVNGGNAASHHKFIDKHNLTTPLLVDEGLQIAADYDAVVGLGPLKLIKRTVVGIEPGGTIAFYRRGTPSTEDILEAIRPAAV